ncbi:MAG TPA: hypothetical protein VKV04_22875 [Verrucomicrobiae bacterium]|nr:hypothetical protein [Verrucomicrobiae bacterium]
MNCGNSITRALALTMAAMGAGAHAADQDSYPQRSSFAVSVEAPPKEPLFFWERFDSSFENDVNDVFADALTPQNAIRWNLNLPGKDFSTRFYDRTTKAADSALFESFKYSTRDAVVGIPTALWLDTRQGWFGDLVRGSIDNVGEESLSSVNASYSVVQQAWWKGLLRDGGTYYGVRPISTSPYAYISHGIMDGGGKTVMLANVRYYYDHFSDHRFELALSLPLADGLSADLGTAYRFGGQENNNKTCAIQLIKEISGHGVAHLGVQVQQHPIMLAGVTFTW